MVQWNAFGRILHALFCWCLALTLMDHASGVLEGIVALRLRRHSDAAKLKRDIVFDKNSVVFLDGANQILQTGEFQLRVGRGAILCVYNLNLIDGSVPIGMRFTTCVVIRGLPACMHVCFCAHFCACFCVCFRARVRTLHQASLVVNNTEAVILFKQLCVM